MPERMGVVEKSATEREAAEAAIFEDEAGGTRVTMRLIFASAEARDQNVRDYGSIEGGKQTFERLAEYLAGRFSGKMATA